MTERPLSVLLVEDDPVYARLITELLDTSRYAGILHVTRVVLLSEALARMEANDFDVLLLDVGLPDSQGLDTVLTVRRAAPELPVVVLTGRDDIVAPQALRAGAQDYLIKGSFGDELLTRSLRYAVERHLLQGRLRAQRSIARLRRDRRILDLLSVESDTEPAFSLPPPLAQAQPELFAELAHRYQQMVAGEAEADIDLTGSDDLQAFVDRLVVLHADATDVLRMHDEAGIAVSDEVSRSLLVEVLARLANAYRSELWSVGDVAFPIDADA